MILVQKYRKSNISSGSFLAAGLGIKTYSPRVVCKSNDLIINWGLSDIPWLCHHNVLNHPIAVKTSSNKLLSFKEFERKEVKTVPFTTDINTVKEWLKDGRVVARDKLTGSSGEGIRIVENEEDILKAPLYTKYIPKIKEFRVHSSIDRVIHIQQKRRLTTAQLEERGITLRNKLIRNLDNGYIFSNNVEGDLSKLEDLAKKAIVALGLIFGAVDIILDKSGEYRVLEVNTAPGLEGTTLIRYIEYFRNYYV